MRCRINIHIPMHTPTHIYIYTHTHSTPTAGRQTTHEAAQPAPRARQQTSRPCSEKPTPTGARQHKSGRVAPQWPNNMTVATAQSSKSHDSGNANNAA